MTSSVSTKIKAEAGEVQPLPQCDVIIPCFNHGAFLRDAVESTQASRYPNVKITIVNDGSTDEETIRVLKAYEACPQVQVVSQANQGLASARNAGIGKAVGKYILPLDADDKIHSDFITRAVNELERDSQVGIVSCGVEFFGDRTGRYELPPYRFPSILLRNSFVCSCVFRRSDWEAVGGYKTNLIHGGEDWDFWISLLELGRSVVQFDETMFYYRKHGASMITSSTMPSNIRETKKAIWMNHRTSFQKNRIALLKDQAKWFAVRHGLIPQNWY